MKRLLIITYDFPPIGGVSVQRVLSLVKYLPQQGFDITVLAAKNPASPVFDETLMKQIPACVSVERVWTPEISYKLKTKLWASISSHDSSQAGGGTGGLKTRIIDAIKTVFSPDPHVVWTPLALRRARKIVRRKGIDAVLVTAPPFSAFLIGNALKREFPHLLLVSDFRDEWLRYLLRDFAFFKGNAAQRKAAVIERDTVALSDLIIAVTHSSIAQLRDRYADQPAEKFAVVPNGYDPEAFVGFRPRPHGRNKIVVTYVGTVYSVCSPRYYLDALDKLPADIRDHFETVFIGRVVEDERKYLESRKSCVRIAGFLPQPEAFRRLEEADYVLLTVTNDFCIAGKLFEYLRAEKPIIGITPPDGETGRVIAATGGGWCVDPTDTAGIRELLSRIYDDTAGGSHSFAPNRERILYYERPRLAAKIGDLIDRRLSGRIPQCAGVPPCAQSVS